MTNLHSLKLFRLIVVFVVVAWIVPAWSAEDTPVVNEANALLVPAPGSSPSVAAAPTVPQAPALTTVAKDAGQISKMSATANKDSAAQIGKTLTRPRHTSTRYTSAVSFGDRHVSNDRPSRSCSGSWCGVQFVLMLGIGY
jgi:hypothetical protein